jgi:hypothetical protein
MSKKREKLYGYTGLFIVLGIWTPILWFVSSSRQYYKMETFDILKMNWFNMLIFFALCAATLVAQYGFVLIAHELSEFDKLKKQQSANRYGGE